METKYKITEEDNKEILVQYIPTPQYGDGISEIRPVISKEAFIECYNKWIKDAETQPNE